MPRWLVELGGTDERIAEAANIFAFATGGPRIVREVGGIYLAHDAFERLDNALEVAGSAQEFVARLRMAASLDGRDSTLAIGYVVESATGERTWGDSSPLARGPEGIDPPERPPIERVVEEFAGDPIVVGALGLVDEGTWGSLVECIQAIERDIGPLRDQYGDDFSESDMIRFDSAAIAQGFDRPANDQVAAMSLDQARTAIRNVVRSWLYKRFERSQLRAR